MGSRGCSLVRRSLLLTSRFAGARSSSTSATTSTTFRAKFIQKSRFGGHRFYSIFEPEYLDSTEREIPKYKLLNFQITGYDFPVLEAYGKFLHNTAERIGIDVEDGWATPCKKLKITRLMPESTIAESEYQLNLYERNVQISEVPTTMLQMFINFVEAALPAGVNLRVHPHDPSFTEIRYVPDLELKELRVKLDSMTFTKKDEGRKK